MKLLLIDAGNSRIKWCYQRGSRLGRVNVVEWTEASLHSATRRVFAQAPVGTPVWLASVAGPRANRALRVAARTAGCGVPRLVRSGRGAFGVTSAYLRPAQLGVDRWLSLLAVNARYPNSAACVVSSGTALTVDLIDRGRHLGGAIVPGPALMAASLLDHTALLRLRSRQPGPRGLQLFARDTRGAIVGGCCYAAAALVLLALRRARARLGRPVRLLLSGGGARALSRILRQQGFAGAVHNEEMVLRGLSIVACSDTRIDRGAERIAPLK